jgi:erythronate-4-phosphate dehydrogenase
VKIVADRNIPQVEACFEHLGQVHLVSGREITPDMVADAEVLLVRSVTRVNKELLKGSRVRFVATATIGMEHVDIGYIKKRKIGFASAPGSNANSVAEWVVAALLSIGNKHKLTLAGKSIGIVGVGNVGSRVAAKCRALGMEVVLNDPPLARETGDPQYRSLEEIYACDFVTLHTPLTHTGPDKTFHLADAAFLNALKPGAVFINSSRGAVHDTEALKTAIKERKLRAVALDVWENEPRVDEELLRLVDLSTPHIAGYSLDGKITGLMMIYLGACEFFAVTPVHHKEDFLPEPEIPEIHIDNTPVNDQDQCHQTVQRVYAINRDDFNMREMLMVPPEQRGTFFDDLRKNYPVRREFQNTRVTLAHPGSLVSHTLRGIGFNVMED